MIDTIQTVYHALESNPALWIGLTLAAYLLGQFVFKLTRFNPLASPIIVAVILIMSILLTFGIDYDTYFSGAYFIHFLLGPTTVVLAVPLFEQRRKLARLWLPIGVSLIAGSAVAIVSVVFLGWLLGIRTDTLISLIPKSVTTPIAMGISAELGGLPDLTACLVVVTGILGALISKPLYRIFHFENETVRGLALGLAAHGMGTSAAFQISNRAGAFAGLAMGLTGLLTAFMAPLLAIPLMRWLGL